MNNTIYIWSDGSCRNKDGKHGGCGIVLKYGQHEKHVSLGQYVNTTSARMEILGAIEALRLIRDKTKKIKLYCDNMYCVKGISEGWAKRWEKENWVNRNSNFPGTKRTNHDLWKLMLIEVRKFPKGFVQFYHIKGHQKGDSEAILMNNLADRLASIGGQNQVLIDDSIENVEILLNS